MKKELSRPTKEPAKKDLISQQDLDLLMILMSFDDTDGFDTL
jgi:hypothetical protein